MAFAEGGSKAFVKDIHGLSSSIGHFLPGIPFQVLSDTAPVVTDIPYGLV